MGLSRTGWIALVCAAVAAAAGVAIGAMAFGDGHMSDGVAGMPRGMPDSVDARFIAMMIPHHEGAIAMADLALQRSKRPEIRELARDIARDQRAEISKMVDLYRDGFDEDPPMVDMADMADMDAMMGGPGMGMAQHGMGSDLERLRAAADFDREFLAEMIPHHGMALPMAEGVRVHGEIAELRDMAGRMIAAQSREIGQMQRWRESWYPPRG